MTYDNNTVVLQGKISKPFTLIKTYDTEKAFYMTEIITKRLSGHGDRIPVMVSDKSVDVTGNCMGRYVKITGQFRSYNEHSGEQVHLRLYVFAQEWSFFQGEEFHYENRIFLRGFVCKHTVYRRTPLGREITDVLVAVNRANGRSDYLPCICWGKNAKLAGNLWVGAEVRLDGRIQSRQYDKKSTEGTECKTAYEISVSGIESVFSVNRGNSKY